MNDKLERLDNDKINDDQGRYARRESKKNCENPGNRRKMKSENKKEELERKEIDETYNDDEDDDHENENDEENEKNDILYEEIPEDELGKNTKSNNIFKLFFCKATTFLIGKR